MKKSVKTALRITALVVLAILVGLSIYTVNAQRIGGNALPMPFGVGATVVLSGSMEPALSVGDLLIVVKADQYQVGDMVVYQTGGTGVVHRIIAIDGDTVTTQGDANNAPDAAISLSQIKGKVAFSIPKVGNVVNWVKSPVVTVILLAGAVFLLEGSFRKDKKKDKEQAEALKEEIRRLKNEE